MRKLIDYRLNLALRFLTNKKGIFMGAVMAVVFGVVLINVNIVIFDGLWDGLIRDFSDFVFGDVYIMDDADYITKSDSALIIFLENYPYVQSATPRLNSIASMNASKNGQTIEEFRIPLIGVKPVQDIRTSTIYEHVTNPKFIPTRNSIVIGDKVARDLGGLEIGDKIDVKIENRWGQYTIKKFTVSDIAAIYGFFGYQTYIHIDTLREMMDRKGETEGILVKLYDKDDTDKFVKVLENHLKEDEYQIQTLEEAADYFLDTVRAGISMLGLIGLFSLMSSAFIIFSIQSMAVIGKTRQVGIIRSIGATKKDIVIIFLIQGILIGIVGVTIGTVVGLGFALFIDVTSFEFASGTSQSIILEINYNWEKIIQTALFSMSLTIIGSLVPALWATKISPIEAMRSK